MFDFENLEVYKKAKELHIEVFDFLNSNHNIDAYINSQLKRASISMIINIAEGSGRYSNKDKRNFYIISRSSVYECVALFDILLTKKQIGHAEYEMYYKKFEEISKMLFGLIKSND